MKEIAGVFFATLIIFIIIHIIHFTSYNIQVVLYSSLLDSIIAISLVAIILYYLKSKKIIGLKKSEICLVLLNSFLILSLYSILIPTAIDRSVSLYILNTIDAQTDPYPVSNLDELVKKKYIIEMNVIGQRLIEQKASGRWCKKSCVN